MRDAARLATPAGAPDRVLTGTLIGFAPAAGEIGHLLRIAIDAEQVGATLLHLPADQPDLPSAVSGLREHTDLVLTCDRAHPGLDVVSSGFERTVLDHSDDLPDVVGQVARLVAEHPSGIAVTGRGRSTLPVLLATLAAGGHVMVEPAEPGDHIPGAAPSGRDHVALIARASGLARIAGRPPLDRRAARTLLGLP
ncbi:hypothetical protein ABIB25_001533 [Nakamurella sp. UYEF19]|uniref:hypothetical protein n=1 Tax=Nakamurella sp. UYEF19 TaxID=1756392 RepID=UPI00339218CA